MKGPHAAIPILLSLLLAGLAVVVWLPSPPRPMPPLPAPAPPVAPPLSVLADTPDWSSLNAWQEQITREEFLDRIERVYTVSSAWRDWFHLGTDDVLIETGTPGEDFQLRFADGPTDPPAARSWRAADELGPAPAERPLAGLRVAIDPGHLGGTWATVEERWFQYGSAVPVKEGDLTLLVATLLQPRLEALGARVSLVRETTEPVTRLRPDDLLGQGTPGPGETPRQLAERLFYRTAEIQARAQLVNDKLHPDLVVCLHFNAEPWGNPDQPSLVDAHHFHLLLNGAYMDAELAFADQRYELTRHLVTRTYDEEFALARHVAAAFVRNTGLPPYLYEPNSQRAANVGGSPYLWARNLLANRLYHCPVVFLEPYVMNSVEDHARIQAGDYEGLREVHGKQRPSIFREYADSVAEGLADYYRSARAGAEDDDR